MKTLAEHLQEEFGYKRSFRVMVDLFEENDVLNSIENYIKLRNKEVLRLAKENARFESGSDKTGFIYITQLEELL